MKEWRGASSCSSQLGISCLGEPHSSFTPFEPQRNVNAIKFIKRVRARAYIVGFPSSLRAGAVPRNNAADKGQIEGVHAGRQRIDALGCLAIESSGTQASALTPA
jgi:hypothetical protein